MFLSRFSCLKEIQILNIPIKNLISFCFGRCLKYFLFIFRTELSEARILHEKVQQLLYGKVEINGLKKKTEDIERFEVFTTS